MRSCKSDMMMMLMLLLLLVGGGRASSGHCSLGWTEPRGEIALAENMTLDIRCELDPKERPNRGRNSSHMSFYVGSEKITEGVHIEGPLAIALHRPKVALQEMAYYCKLEQDNGSLVSVCFNHVVVGTAPRDVLNFSCISSDWNNLTCTWRAQHNFLRTSYDLSFRLPHRSQYAVQNHCPEVKEDKLDYSCFWHLNSSPPYNPYKPKYYFTLNATNKFGSRIQQFTFDHFKHVKLAKVHDLTLTHKTARSASLSWRVSPALHTLTPGLEYHVAFTSEYNSSVWTAANTSALPHNVRDSAYTLTDLYPFTAYDVRVRVRPRNSSDSMWSDIAFLTFTTLSDIPECPPDVDPNSIEISADLKNRTIVVYWNLIHNYQQNGENFEYLITAFHDGQLIDKQSKKENFASFGRLPLGEVVFHIYSVNKEGRSTHSSVLRVPHQNYILPDPHKFTKTARNNSIYELAWEPATGKKAALVQGYTLFWCEKSHDKVYPCKGGMQWISVPADVHQYNISVPDEIFDFAIAAHSDNSTSGMTWAKCTIVANRMAGKIKDVWVNRAGAKYIELGWKLECTDDPSFYRTYRISYCPIDITRDSPCLNARNVTITRDPSSIYSNITDLQPYTMYSIKVCIVTYDGLEMRDGQMSDELISTTLDAAPSLINTTRATMARDGSMLISWDRLPANATNGKLRHYKVYYDTYEATVNNTDSEVHNFTLKNLKSFTNYSIRVEGCTVECSNGSRIIRVRTPIGVPSQMRAPHVEKFNDSLQVKLRWDPPAHPGGNVDVYQVMIVEAATDHNMTKYYNTTHTNITIQDPTCQMKGKATTMSYSVRAINFANLPNQGAAALAGSEDAVILPGSATEQKHTSQQFVGNWSSSTDKYCLWPTDYIWYWFTAIVLLTALTCFLFVLSKRLWNRYKSMQDIHVRLPPGLEYISTKDGKFPSDNRGLPNKLIKDEKRNIITSADEVTLLKSRINMHPNKDDSVKTDSTTQSLTSSHLSSESKDADGEMDAPQGRADSGLSLRLGNVCRPASASSSPAVRSSPAREDPPVASYSAVGACPPPEFFKTRTSPHMEFTNPKDELADLFSSDGITPEIKSIPERTVNGYVPASSLPQRGLFLAEPREAELPPGYTKAAPALELAPVPAKVSSGYVAVSDAMLLKQPQAPVLPVASAQPSPPQESPYISYDDIQFNNQKLVNNLDAGKKPGDMDGYCRFSWDVPDTDTPPASPAPETPFSPASHYLPLRQ